MTVMPTESTCLADLDSPKAPARLEALRGLARLLANGDISPPVRARDVNNHIHTTYSFSPYSPAKAAWLAFRAGLSTAGIMDHDSVGGIREFLEAGAILGLPVTGGLELRVDFAGTPFADRHINNPDQAGVAYVALHGIPHDRIDTVARYLEPVQSARGRRNRAMTARLSALLSQADLSLDYDRDILPLSMAHEGGSVTERHLLFAVARKLLARFPSAEGLLSYLQQDLALPLAAKQAALLADPVNPHREYDLLGILKGGLVERFYIPATDECPDVAEVAEFCRFHGILLAYAYLGDVTESVTGDKKAQHFEDAYLDGLFDALGFLGFHAVTYMPSRNTAAQLDRVRALCRRHGLFEISGEDINQPRQSFVCEAMRDPRFESLHDAAFALIGHERLSTGHPAAGMFSDDTIRRIPDLDRRIRFFRDAALSLATAGALRDPQVS